MRRSIGGVIAVAIAVAGFGASEASAYERDLATVFAGPNQTPINVAGVESNDVCGLLGYGDPSEDSFDTVFVPLDPVLPGNRLAVITRPHAGAGLLDGFSTTAALIVCTVGPEDDG